MTYAVTVPCPSATELQALVGAAPPTEAERERITSHAETCDACRAALVALVRGNATTEVSTPSEQAPSGELAPGTRVDRYVIEHRLGAGAMGVVYAARDPELDRLVAVKLLHARQRGEALKLRLAREARALARVSHPNVVTVHDVGTHGDDVFVAMELVRGETMRAWLARGQPPDAIVAALVAAGRGLAAAHEVGLVHRDFKPDNVLVGDDGRVRVTDFGLARAVVEGDDGEPAAPISADAPPVDSPLLATLTQTGSMVGTPVYAAPEQLAGRRVSPRSDQFSFCVTAYEALGGQRPFAGATYAELVANIERGEIRTAELDEHIARVVRRGLAADPDARFPSMTALVDALAPPAAKARRRLPWLVAGGATAVAGIAIAVIASREQGAARPRCDARARMAQVWTPALSAALAAEPRAELDGYAAQWISERDRICEAAKGDVATALEQAPRAACLDGALLQFRVVVTEAIAHPRRTVLLIERGLSQLEACARSRGEIPAEPAPGIAERVAKARGALGEARAAHALGERARAEQLVATVVAEAAVLGYVPLDAELEVIHGSFASARGDSPKAIEHFRKASKLAEASRHDRVKADAAAALARVLVQIGRFDEAIGVLDLAEATLTRLGGDLGIESSIVSHRARIADAQGKTAEAIQMLESAIARFRRAPRSTLVVALVQLELQTIFVRLGRNTEAAQLLAAASPVLRMFEAEGAAVTELADACEAAQLAGDFDRANAVCARSVAELEVARPVDEAALIAALQSLGVTHELQMHWQAAHVQMSRAADLAERSGRILEAAFLAESAGRSSIELGMHERAIAELRRSVGLAARAGADGTDQLLFSRTALGRAYATAANHAPAIGELEWGIPRLEARNPPSLNALAGARFALAEALWQRSGPGDRERAKQLAALAREGAIRYRDSFPADTGLDAIYRRRMDVLLAKIDAWLARR